MEHFQHHHQPAHLPYDSQIHEVPATNGEHGQHINYDQTDGGGPTGMLMMMMMKMYFHFGLGETVLFETWQVSSAGRMWLSCALIFVAAILLEAIDYSRGYLSCRCAQTAHNPSQAGQTQSMNSESLAGLVRNQPSEGQAPQQWSCCSGSQAAAGSTAKKLQYFPIQTSDSHWVRALQSGLHFVRTSLSLCLMLVAMTYNVCLIFPIVLGSGIGFYIFYRPALDSKSVMCH